MKKYSSPVLLFISTLNILPALLDENPRRCVFEVWGERRENVSSGSEFCWSWPSFSCPSLTEQIVKEKENITLCCPGFHEDTEGNCIEMNEEDTREENSTSTSLKFNFNCIGDCKCSEEGCEDNNLLYLLVILPLIIVVILILVLVYCIYKMKAKLRTLRDQRSSQGRQNEESTENHQQPGRDKIVNNSLYYDNSGFCTDKNINKDSTARVSVQNNETNVKEKKPLKSDRGKTVNNPLYNFDNSGFCTISEKNINKEATVKVALHKELQVNSSKAGPSDRENDYSDAEYDHLNHQRSINDISGNYLLIYT